MNLVERVGLWLINRLETPGSKRAGSISIDPAAGLSVDVYEGADGSSAPVILFFYGGNWARGERRQYQFVGEAFAKLGITVLVADYRKRPDVRFEDTLSDANKALDWTLANYRGRPIVLSGHSAGAQIACLSALDKTRSTPGAVAGVIGLAGPYDFYPFTEREHWDYFGPPWRYPLTQPVWRLHATMPSFLLLHGAADQRVRRGHSKSLYLRVLASEGLAIRRVYERLDHTGIVLEFMRGRRHRSRVMIDIQQYLSALTKETLSEMEKDLWH
jgi:acetyl esterase/lipase